MHACIDSILEIRGHIMVNLTAD